MPAPQTSTTLLRQLAADSQHVRWGEFVCRYQPMMAEYLRVHFPGLEADDIVSETLIALVDVLKNYRYAPDETGNFHNYLTGIMRHKALRLCKKRERSRALCERVAAEPSTPPEDPEEEEYRQSLFNVAVCQYFDDETVAPRTKEIFRRTAMKGESPELVAKSFMIERHAVDQIKSRSIAKLRTIIEALEKADD